MWCIPGSALPSKKGWKLWYSQQGGDEFAPKQPKVYLCSDPNFGNPQKRADQQIPSILEGKCLPAIDGLGRRMFVGELVLIAEQVKEGDFYWIELPEKDKPLILQIPPTAIPNRGLSFILSSCFWRNDDKTGEYARGISQIMQKVRPTPSFKLLIGDQVYLDYPLIFRNAHQRIKNRYIEYWGDPHYRDSLSACANYFTCDDHEYWNNFPDRQVQLPYTYTESSRKAFTAVAEDCYQQFQGCLNPTNKTWYTFDIHPASFFTIDTRSARSAYKDSKPCFMEEEQWMALEEWQQTLKGPGILTIGQPIFQRDGSWADYSLSNYAKDYGRLLNIIKRSFDGDNNEGKRHDIVILTGDIHHGRHASGWLGPGQELHEFVSSPASRIGPFISEPKVEKLPTVIQAAHNNKKIKISNVQTISKKSLELFNHTAVVKLTPIRGGKLEIDFSIYQVRPYTRPSWNFFKGKRSTQSTFQRSYSSSQVKKIILQ